MSRALVVDDTKNIRILLTTCLEVCGYEVITASNGSEAIKLLETEVFDLAFLDVKMPEVSGTGVLKHIRSLDINMPVVIMTAFATIKNAIDCTKLGAVAYLQKPFTAEKVKSLLSEIEDYRCVNYSEEIYIKNAIEQIDKAQLDAAYTNLKKALSINPSNAECYRLIGQVNELKGMQGEADRFYAIAKQFNQK
ncbi:MAG: response regulator [Bacillota bacterium]|nr:response regulator [Bacillota bacterium]